MFLLLLKHKPTERNLKNPIVNIDMFTQWGKKVHVDK